MHGHVMLQEQTARALPEQILASSVLKMDAVELAHFVCEQIAENPALSFEDVDQCPVCGTPISESTCSLCGAAPADLPEPLDVGDDEWGDHSSNKASKSDLDSDFDPFVLIASPVGLPEYLRSQIRMVLTDPRELKIALFIIDALDDDGYFRENLYEIASSLNAAVPDVEKTLKSVQALDPPGIAVRNIRECLLLQLRRLEDEPLARLTTELLEVCWDDLARLKLPIIADRLKVEVEDVRRCIEFMRERLNPRPASAYRDPWAELAPSFAGRIVPDVIIRMHGESPAVEVFDFQAGLLKLDEECQAALDPGSHYSVEDRKRIREFVEKARCVLDAVQLRRKTLAKIALALAEYQKDYLVLGPRRLKPLKQKELAAAVGIHESVTCRALSGKFVRLPSGEVVPFDTFFDSSLPAKEIIRVILAKPGGQALSDSDIARRLAEQGIQIARRTVAKYRNQLRMPAAQGRMQGLDAGDYRLPAALLRSTN